MENNKKKEILNEKLNSILEELQKTIELYNNLNPQEKLAITPQDNRKDVKDIVICVYNNRCVGLFKKINWNEEPNYCDPMYYEAGSVYIGIDSNFVGMKITHCNLFPPHDYEKPGATCTIKDKGTYVTNCEILDEISFESMRLILYNNGKIGPYEIGKASPEEILEILTHASKYFKVDNLPPKKRRIMLDNE